MYKWKSTISLIAILTTSMSGWGCSSSDFSSAPKKKPATILPQEQPLFPDQGTPLTERFQGFESEAGRKPVDVIFVMDTSGSMLEEKSRLESTMDAFMNAFFSSANQIDIRVFMLGADFNFPASDPSKLTLVNQRVGSRDALSILSRFLKGEFSSNLPLRNESIKEAVIFTDDDAGEDTSILSNPGGGLDPFGGTTIPGFPGGLSNLIGMNAAQFKTDYATIKEFTGELHINGVIGQNQGKQNDWCTIENVGSQYQSLASDPEFKGIILDLCNEDWNALLTQLAKRIIDKNRQEIFILQQQPDTQREVRVSLNGVTLNSSQYEIIGSQLKFHKTSAPASGDQIEISYYF